MGTSKSKGRTIPDTILFVHGRGTKPSRTDLSRLWRGALRAGLQRDYPGTVKAFAAARTEMVYYGDLSNAFLDPSHDTVADSASRKETFSKLRSLKRSDFNRSNYEGLPNQTSLKEFLADALSGVAATAGLSNALIRAVAPDLREYWNADSKYGDSLCYRMKAPLMRALNRSGRVMVVGHSLGSVIVYDTLWHLSRTVEFQDWFTDKAIDLLVTIGSPLGDATVRKKLRGHDYPGELRFPRGIRRWANLAAHDDYISHDQCVANDYHEMITLGLAESISDTRIYNLSVREGKSNPHHSAGYLISPEMSALVAQWLEERDTV